MLDSLSMRSILAITLECRFEVIDAGALQDLVILGKEWIDSTQCQLNWQERTAALCLESKKVTILLCHEEEPASTPSPPTAIQTKLPSSPSAVPIPKPQPTLPRRGNTLLSTPPPQSKAATSTTITSSSKKQPTTHKPHQTGTPTSHHSHANHWWVPSNILAAQGYYDGAALNSGSPGGHHQRKGSSLRSPTKPTTSLSCKDG